MWITSIPTQTSIPCGSSRTEGGRNPYYHCAQGTLTHGKRHPLGQHHDLSTRLVLLHATMRLDDLVELESPADLYPQRAGRYLFDQFLERRPHEVFCFSGIGG